MHTNLPPFFVPIKGNDTKSHLKLWTLKWNKQNVANCIGVLYAVCVAKKKELIKAKTHSEHLFTIELHK